MITKKVELDQAQEILDAEQKRIDVACSKVSKARKWNEMYKPKDEAKE